MSELISFKCNKCNLNKSISEKFRDLRRCIPCHRVHEKEYRENNKEAIKLRVDKDKRKENKVKKRNEKYEFTEEKIKEINNEWDNMQIIMNDFCKKYDHPPIEYKNEMTPRLKQVCMHTFLRIKNWFETEPNKNKLDAYLYIYKKNGKKPSFLMY